MIGTFKIDQNATFTSAHLMGVEPKLKFKSDEQDRANDADNTPKWTAKVAVKYTVFGRSESEIINVNLTSRNDPGDGIPDFSPVDLIGFECNVSEKRNGNRETVPGITQWFRCDEIKPVTTGNAKTGKADA